MRLQILSCLLLLASAAPLCAQPAKITTRSHLVKGAPVTVVHFSAPW